jgi:hypothetical protein
MTGARRMTKVRLADFSRQLKTLIDKAQRLRDEINRWIIATTPPPSPPDGEAARRRRSPGAHTRKPRH